MYCMLNFSAGYNELYWLFIIFKSVDLTSFFSNLSLINKKCMYYYVLGTSLEFQFVSGQFILALFSIFSFFLSIAYSAKIVVLLKSSTNSIQTIQHLINSPLAVGMQDVVYNNYYFKVCYNLY